MTARFLFDILKLYIRRTIMEYKKFKPGDKATVVVYPTPLVPRLRIFTATVDVAGDGVACFDDPRVPFGVFYYDEDKQAWRSYLADPMLGQLGTLVESIDEPINMMRNRLIQYGTSIPAEDYEKASWILDNLDTIPLPILRWASWASSQRTRLGTAAYNLSKEEWIEETSHPDAIGLIIEDTYYSPYDYRIEED